MTDVVAANEAIAAAVAAAAELAKNGGAFMYHNQLLANVHPDHTSMVLPDRIISPATAVNHVGKSTPTRNHYQVKGLSTTSDFDHDGDDDDNMGDEEDAERRIARSRERNREHARRTRLRKKAQLEALQGKVKGLQAENKVLQQSLEECSIASILVGLSSGSQDNVIQSLLDATKKSEESDIKPFVGNKRKRFISEGAEKAAQPLKINIDGQTALIGGGKTHINWKSGVYSDENGVQRQLTQEQLESLRRERNRMHAKMTRDRKKSFIATIEKTIEDLENKNKRIRDILNKVTHDHYKSTAPIAGVTPLSSPEAGSVRSSVDDVPSLHTETPPAKKKVRHGFTGVP